MSDKEKYCDNGGQYLRGNSKLSSVFKLLALFAQTICGIRCRDYLNSWYVKMR